MPRNLLALLVAGGFATCPGTAFANPEAGKVKARPCAVCHGQLGVSMLPDAPHLAGQPERYLADQLKAYRSGKRTHEIMTLMAKPLSDEDIADLAAWFSSLQIEVKPVP